MIRKRTSLFTPIACLLATCLLTGSGLLATAQTRQGGVSVKTIIGMVDSFNTKLPSEKLFLHFDKPYYAVGDTMWFKAYLFQGATNTWSPLSGLLYLELISDSDKLIKRMSFPIGYGISWGQIPLIPDDIAAGRYTVYAYTNWMQNAGPAGFFHQRFSIGGPPGIQIADGNYLCVIILPYTGQVMNTGNAAVTNGANSNPVAGSIFAQHP